MAFSIYQLKPKFQQLLQPLLGALLRRGITPNQITLAALGLSLLYGAALAGWPHQIWLWLGVPLVMLLRMALNALDGMLANQSGQKTPLGALLNELGDQISDVALYLPFALAPGVNAGGLVLVVILALLAEFTGVLALALGAPRRFDGPMGKSDRAFVFGLLALLIAVGVPAIWLHGLLLLVALLLVWTTANRFCAALAHAQPER